ncbi:FAD-dependent oxidoreductase [Microbacterium sp. STN6]|uniref:FAD-dependent oxidoreductase n=1 Tax=Microbacterium sp. STN6 TaxID=2995588 RepID=UPI002260BE31|nr:FAD-dependent oxidoreductase [Microbacterium sp. STN6]MCX7522505.1 FAD-dependent oxidoreductase [Microbacterium sp. STN6]
MNAFSTEIIVAGGGAGGVSAALAALRRGRRVVMSERYDWLGGQFTSQAVPPDEHPWIEEFGLNASYRALRDGVRDVYRRDFPLTDSARRARELNPGGGWVSKLCAEPKIFARVIEGMLAPYVSAGRLVILRGFEPTAVDVDADRIHAVTFTNPVDGRVCDVTGHYVLDATEAGDLLPLANAEYVTGAESRDETGEPSAPGVANPQNMQGISWCFALDHVDGDHTIDRPAGYDRWRSYWPAVWPAPMLSFSYPDPRTLGVINGRVDANPPEDPLAIVADQSKVPSGPNLWTFRRIAARKLFADGFYDSDITLVNWPQMDYFERNIIDVPASEAELAFAEARELSLSLLYWLQTDAPRGDGGTGMPGLRLRPDVTGTVDGLAQAPYIRESRRIRAVTTVVEQDLSFATRAERGAVHYRDGVGVGMYRLDLHPSTTGDNYLDVSSTPFEIPLGALLPQRMINLLAAGKNIGTTHITNGCYRLHPVEWNIGEAAGALAAHCLDSGLAPHQVQEADDRLEAFTSELQRAGVTLRWPQIGAY